MIDSERIEGVFSPRGFNVCFFGELEEASLYLADYLKGRKCAFGGSITLEELGLYDRLTERPIWHWRDNPEEARREAQSAEVYLLSANALSLEGQIINIDGTGNRISTALFGPKEAIYVIGRNKVEETFEKALWRARNIAAVKNAIRLNRKTPCVKSGKCMDCNSPERICRGFSVITHPMMGVKTTLVFVDEDLGY